MKRSDVKSCVTRLAWLLVMLACACGCGLPASEVVAACVPAGPAVRLRVGRGREQAMGLGVLDGKLLVLHGQALEAGESHDWRLYAQWFDQAGESLAPEQELGVFTMTVRSRLIALNGALHAQLSVDPSGALPAAHPDDVLGMWEFRPPDQAQRHEVILDISKVPACPRLCGRSTLGFSSGSLSGGGGRLPAAVTSVGVWSAISGVPDGCDEGYTSQFRPWLFSAGGGDLVQWWSEDRMCAVHDADVAVGNVELVTLDRRADLGMLFRLGSGHVYYLRLHEGQPVGQPRRVGGTWLHVSTDGGYQPEGTRVGRHIFFFERAPRDTNGCQVLRRIDFNGHGGSEIAWQLPCRHDPRLYSSSVELETLPLDIDGAGEVAASVWSEHTSFPSPYTFVTRVTRDVDYHEGIYLALVNEHGQRISEPVKVTPDESTTLLPSPRTETSGPYPQEYRGVETAAEGNSIYVMWSDLRLDAPGRYVRRFDCSGL